MIDERSTVTRDEFDRLVARAVELEEAGPERLTMSRAGQIAAELGITPMAWEAAVREFSVNPSRLPDTHGSPSAARTLAVMGLGFAAGFTSGAFGASDVYFAAGMWLVAAAIAVTGSRSRSRTATVLELAAWWLAVPIGIMVGASRFLTDPMWFGAFSVAGSVIFHEGLRWWARRRPVPLPPVGDSPTA